MKNLTKLILLLLLYSGIVKADTEPGNNTPGTTTDVLTTGGSQSGSVGPGDNYDYFLVTTGADGNLTISLSNDNNAYTYIYLYDQDGVTQLGNTSGSAQLGISFTTSGLAAGNYYVSVYSAQVTNYTVNANLSSPLVINDAEPNNNTGQATSISMGTNHEGHIAYRSNGGTIDNDDYFSITTVQDGDITVSLSNDNNNYTYIYLYDADGVTQLGSTSGSASSGISFTTTGLAAGNYFVRIYSNAHSGYTFNASLSANPIQNDPISNNSFLNAPSFLQNDSITGHIAYRSNGGSYDNWDYYSFYSNGDYSITISLNNNNNAYNYIYLYDTDTTTQLGSTSGSAQNGISFTVNGLAAGTYYIAVYAAGGAYSGYTLHNSYTANPLANDTEPNNNPAQATVVPYNSTETGHIAYRQPGGTYDNYDYYQFTTPVDGNITISLSNTNNNYNYIYLYDSDGTTQLGGTSGSAQSGISFTTTGLNAGTYYVAVYAGGGAFSGYSLSKSLTPTAFTTDVEPNDGIATSLAFAVNSSLNGHIAHRKNLGSFDNYDYYQITTTQDGTISLSLTNDNNNYTYLYLYDSDGVTQLAGTSGSASAGILCSKAGLAAGTYYAVVYAGGGAYSGYTLTNTLAVTPYNNDTEDNGSFATATVMNNNPSKSGHTGHRYNGGAVDAYDYWKISLLSADSLKLDVQFSNTNYVYLYVYNSSFTQIYSTSGSGSTFHLFFASLPAGDYYFVVNGGSAYNSYVITNFYYPCNPTASVITAGGPTTFCQGDAVGLNSVNAYNSYSWSNGATTGSISVGSSGSYTLTAFDFDGCPHVSNTITVTALPNATYYADVDGDGYGNAGTTQSSCTGAPSGYVANNTDCNDGNATIHPGATEVCNGIDDNCNTIADEGLLFTTYYADADGDGYGNISSTQSSCGATPSGYVANSNDCDDGNQNINPGAAEACNGIDDNCNGQIDEGCSTYTYFADADADGYGNPANSISSQSSTPPVGYVANNSDCNDGNAAINPSATEICNGIDDNCNGLTDDGVTFVTYYADADGDTYGNAAVTQSTCNGAPNGYVSNNSDCNDAIQSINPGASETCNGIDDNCNGNVDEGLTYTTYYADNDGDTYGNLAITQSTCNGAPSGYVANSTDCNDASATTYPGATELCNGIDDNCNGTIDEGCGACNSAPGPITGPSQLCAPTGQFITYSVPVIADALTYSWSVPAGTNIISGQGTNTLVVKFPFPSIHAGVNGDICVFATRPCGTTLSTCLNISVQLTTPVRPPSISGPVKACAGDIGVYSVALVSRADNYNWTLPTGATIITGQGTNVVSVQFDAAFVGGSINVAAANGCGVSPDRSKTIARNILSAPTAINGPSNGVCGQNSITYTCTTLPGATSYFWTVPAGASIVNGQGTATLTVSFSGSFNSGMITVAAQNGCGNGAVRTKTIVGAPATPGAISGQQTTCTHTNYTYEVPVVPGADTYTWTVPSHIQIVSGQGTKQINVMTGNTTVVNFAISVKASNGCGISGVSKLTGMSTSGCIRIAEEDQPAVTLYPNPAHDLINVSIESKSSQNIQLTILDVAGRLVATQNHLIETGHSIITLPVHQLKAGLYVIVLRTDSGTQSIKLSVE